MEKLINNELTDKNTTHSYLATYERLFAPFKDTAKNILEIGVWKGGSIKLWSDYFSNATVYAVDIMEPPPYLIGYPRVLCYGADAYGAPFLNFMKTKKLDIIIDDGPHTKESHLQSLDLYLPKLKPGGMFVIEDIASMEWVSEYMMLVPNDMSYRTVDLREPSGMSDSIIFCVTNNG